MHYQLELYMQWHVLSHIQLDSVIYCTLIQLGLSVRVSYWLVQWLTKFVDCGWHSVKLHPFIQFEWPPWEFELSWHSCTLHDHCIVLSLFYWLYRAETFHCSTIMSFSCLIVLNILWDCVLVPRLLWQINSKVILESENGKKNIKHRLIYRFSACWI